MKTSALLQNEREKRAKVFMIPEHSKNQMYFLNEYYTV